MLNKINCSKILSDHIKTLKYADDNKYSIPDIILFYFAPIAVAGYLYYEGIRLTIEQVNILITVFAIFTGLLLNLLLIVYDIVSKNNTTPTKTKFLHEIYSNISYTILLSIITIIVLIAISFISKITILSALVIALVIHFLLTILMILKRVHILLSKETE
jgi:FtsH-binding integral membrane protein